MSEVRRRSNAEFMVASERVCVPINCERSFLGFVDLEPPLSSAGILNHISALL